MSRKNILCFINIFNYVSYNLLATKKIYAMNSLVIEAQILV